LLAYAQLLADQSNDALDSAKRALALRPLFGPTLEALACCAVALGRHDDASQWVSRVKESDHPESHFLAPLRINQPDYEKRIAQWLRNARAPE
jgi:hypothetical protein